MPDAIAPQLDHLTGFTRSRSSTAPTTARPGGHPSDQHHAGPAAAGRPATDGLPAGAGHDSYADLVAMTTEKVGFITPAWLG